MRPDVEELGDVAEIPGWVSGGFRPSLAAGEPQVLTAVFGVPAFPFGV